MGLPSVPVMSQPHGRPPTAAGMSAPVYTASTPGACFAASVRMARMRAWACGERTKQAYDWCGSVTSSVYCPAPVRKRASSLRSMRAPMGPAGFAARCGAAVPGFSRTVVSVMVVSSARHLGKALLHRLDDVVIARATAKVTVERLADLRFGRALLLRCEPDRGHHHSGRAEAALQAVVLAEGGLHRMELAVGGGEALDRRDRGAVGLDREDVAALHGLSVDQHRARAALGGVAADVRAGELHAAAQEIDKERSGFDLGGD